MRFFFLLLTINLSLTTIAFADSMDQSFRKVHENRKKLYQIRIEEKNRVLFYLNQAMEDVVKQNSTHQTEFGFVHAPVRYEHSSSYLSTPISQYVLTASILLLLTLTVGIFHSVQILQNSYVIFYFFYSDCYSLCIDSFWSKYLFR